MDFTGIDLGPKMLACSEKERAFVWHLVLEDLDATEAARRAGWTDNDTGAIRVTAHRVHHRERVLEAIEELGRRSFRGLLPAAIAARRRLIEKQDHPDHHKAVHATLSQLGFGERVGLDVTHNHTGEVTLNHTDAAIEALRFMRQMAVPREKMVEHFGYSGLERYERMLEEADRRAPKVIEHQVAK